MPNDYVGRYGAALRKLSTLGKTGFGVSTPPQPQPQPPTGAFGAVPPQSAPTPFSAPSYAGNMGAFVEPDPKEVSTPRPRQPESPDQVGPPISASQLWKDMPGEFKSQLQEQIESSGMSIDETFRAKVEDGEIDAPKKEMTRQEKLGYLAEVALRTLSNLSRPDTLSISDFADAKLATDARRGALDQAETERKRKEQETRRLEGRQDTQIERTENRTDQREVRRQAGEAVTEEMRREAIAEEGDKNRKSAFDIANLQRDARLAGPGSIFDDENGNMFRLLPNGEVAPLTVEEERTVTGKRGVKFKEKYRRQIKRVPKQRYDQIDQDTILREVGKRVKLLKEDGALMRELKRQGVANIDQEIAKRARDEVMREFAAVTGTSGSPAPTAPTTPTNPYDQFD